MPPLAADRADGGPGRSRVGGRVAPRRAPGASRLGVPEAPLSLSVDRARAWTRRAECRSLGRDQPPSARNGGPSPAESSDDTNPDPQTKLSDVGRNRHMTWAILWVASAKLGRFLMCVGPSILPDFAKVWATRGGGSHLGTLIAWVSLGGGVCFIKRLAEVLDRRPEVGRRGSFGILAENGRSWREL